MARWSRIFCGVLKELDLFLYQASPQVKKHKSIWKGKNKCGEGGGQGVGGGEKT